MKTARMALLGLPLLLGACGSREAPAAGAAKPAGPPALAQRKVPVQAEPASEREVAFTIETTGSLLPNETVRVPARVPGVLQDIAFVEGALVGPGKVLARVDPERYRLNLDRAEAAAREAEARRKVAQSMLDKRARLKEKDQGWVTGEELANFEAGLEASDAALGAARAQLELARKDHADSYVKSDKAGIIEQKLADTGQYVGAGTPIATLIDSRRLKLSFSVSESEAVALDDRVKISFRLKALPGREFTARLYHKSGEANPRTRMVDVLAWVDTPGGELRPGSFAEVTLTIGEGRRSLVVPQTAVLPTERGFVVYVLAGDGVEPRPVRPGLHTRDGLVEVLDGLTRGERVVVRGAQNLTPSSKVDPQDARTER